MPQYKLTYFNVKGVSEPIRYIFAYAGVDFEDVRIEKEDWPMLKADQPFAQLPVLDTGDAFLLTQSVAIARYLGKTFGLGGRDTLQEAQLDALVDHMQELHWKLYAAIRSGDPDAPKELFARNAPHSSGLSPIEAFEAEILPFYFKKFNAIAAGGAFYGSEITWADVYFAGFADCMVTRLKKDILTLYPHLSALKEKVESSESVQSYLEKRPYCSM